MAKASVYFYRDFDDYEPAAARKHLRPVAYTPLAKLRAVLADLAPWDAPASRTRWPRWPPRQGLDSASWGSPCGVAVTGRGVSPPFDATLALVGRERTLARLDRALDFIRARAAS